MSSQDHEHLADRLLSADNRFRLTVRTSMLSEFRDADGALGAIEVNHQFTSIGALRTAVERLPGVRFDGPRTSLWSPGPSRFTFKGRVYQISTPYQDIRIAPVEAGAAYRETDELLQLIVEHLVPKWQTRARTRFFRV